MRKFSIFIKTMLVSICAFAIAIIPTKAFALQDSSSHYMMLYGKGNGRPTGYYLVFAGNKANKAIIKVVRSADASGSSTASESADEAIFCIKDGIGFGSSDGNGGTTSSVVNYNQYFDMRNPSSIDSTYKANLPQDSTNYTKLMWILDNVVNPSDTTQTATLLKAAEISDSDFDDYNTSSFGGKTTAEIKKDIIESVEQAAIWHYTNAGTEYDPGTSTNFYRASSNGGDAKNLDDVYGDGNDYDSAPHNVLYSYLINNAEKNASYNYASSGLTSLSLDKSSAKAELSGDNVVIGPYTINKTGSSNYSINATVTSGNNTISNSDVQILNASKSAVSGTDVTSKIKSTIGSAFYISVPVKDVSGSVKFNVSGNSTGKTITYWSAPASQVSVTQPIAIVKTQSQPISLEDEQTYTQNIEGKYNVILVKEDSTGKQLNSTATFVVNGETKTVTGELTIAKDVEINSSNVNTPDVYTIKETVPPDKYCKFDGTIKVTVNKKLENNAYITSSDLISYKVFDDNGNEISKNGTNVYLKDGNIYVEVKDEEEKIFDLALRKFITSVNGVTPEVSREPEITQDDLKALAEGDTTKAFDNGTTTYKKHTKDPLAVSTGDKVVYTIRIYNEGQIDGKATEITDYLPEGLKLVEDSEINKTYGWTADASNSQIVRTTKLSDTTLKAFSKTQTDGKYVMSKEGGQIADVQIECEVTAHSATAVNLKNVAEITKETNDQNIKDIDSTPGNLTDAQLKDYNPSTATDGKGYEDDDDYEILKLVRFDLALRKFITGVNDTEVTNRVPQVDTSKFGTTDENGNEITTCTYNHTKEPVRVEHNDIVTYTIRIYNEGTQAGYASVVKDDLPEGIEFLPDNATNKEYRWVMYDADGNVTDDVSKANYVTTDYLSKEQEKTAGANLLKPFDKDSMESPDYRDVKIAFKVTMPNTSDRIVTNKAQISKHTDENGKEVKDIDSTPDKWIEGEDDQDIEKIYVKYFDLALRKWVTQAIVIEDGQEKVMETGHKAEDDPESVVKVEINKKRLQNTVVKFKYSIRITNEGEIAGYATEISDYIPKGLKFNQADNPDWKEANGKIVTNALKDTLLQPGDQGFVDVILTWENDENNMGVMTNVAEISADKNDSDTPDIDSTPNNKKEGEDDIDDAPVALTVNAGKAKTYTALIASILSIVGVGAILIKKFAI